MQVPDLVNIQGTESPVLWDRSSIINARLLPSESCGWIQELRDEPLARLGVSWAERSEEESDRGSGEGGERLTRSQ